MPVDKTAKPNTAQNKDAPKPFARPSGGGLGNYRSVYILEGDDKSAKPVRKAFRLGLSDGEYSEILPLKKDQAPE